MRCEDFESRLNDVLDERRAPSSAADVAEHIGRCAACRDLSRAYGAVLTGLRQTAPPTESMWLCRRPAELSERIVAQARRPRVLRLPARRRAVLAAAAALLAAAGLTWMLRPAGQSAGPPLADALDRPPGAGRKEGSSARSGSKTFAARKRRNGAAIDPRSVSAMPSATALPNSSNADDLNAGELMRALPGADWAQDVANGLQPVTSPTVGAINGFLHLWGVGDEGRRS